jgi:DGQHR domain-containing protein
MTARRIRSRAKANAIRLPALRIRQGGGQEVYSFAVEGKKLRTFAAVSRVKRSQESELSGYQRPESLAHIRAIRRYLESDEPIMPNAIVVAFDERVSFEPLTRDDADGADAMHGHLVIPCSPDEPDAEKPGWIVDGQQRSAALREAHLEAFPVYVTAFVARDEAQQRSQFILVNATKPLPKGLIHELLPSTAEDLPVVLTRRRLPAYLTEQLNFREDSPLHGRIRTPTMPGGVIKDNSVLRMLERSISDGTLYHYRDPKTGWGDTEAMLDILSEYWSAGAAVFGDAWDRSPRESRLVHGVGFISLGALMDEIAERIRGALEPTRDVFAAHLEVVAPSCAWTSGYWQLGAHTRRAWNDIQNTGREVQLLSDHLIGVYRIALEHDMATDSELDAA